MHNLAICFYGVNDSNYAEAVEKCTLQFSSYQKTFFCATDNDVIKALWLSSFKKSESELLNNTEFDICIAINLQNLHLVPYITIPENLDNSLYFLTGWFNQLNYTTGVGVDVFFAKSQTFNRASEFYLYKSTTLYKHDGFTRNRVLPIEEDFFYHLKVFYLPTKCIQYENRNLFKWST